MLDSKLKMRLILISILFLITLLMSSYSILRNNQLEGWMSEDHYDIGLHFAKTGTLALPGGCVWSAVEKPPGYSFFLGTILKIWTEISAQGKELLQIDKPIMVCIHTDAAKESYQIIYFVQAVLLSISTIIIFIWLSDYIRISTSFVIALLFGCNPYMIIYVGLMHYEILHIFLIVVSSYALLRVLSQNKGRGWKMILPGILWGLTTLTRPTTLILPTFICIFFLIIFPDSRIKAIKLILLFSAGMLVTIAPYTIRNYRLTGKFIPVNLQSGVALWDGTVIKLNSAPNHYGFWGVWYTYGFPIAQRVLERHSKEPEAIALDREFMHEAVHNILHHPNIYLYNVANSFISFCIDINSVFIKIFQAVQIDKASHYTHKDWLEEGNPQNFYSSTYQKIFEFYIYILTFLSFSGILLFIRRFLSYRKNTMGKQRECFLKIQTNSSENATKSYRDFWIENSYFLGTIIICVTLFIAHSITYLGLMYYYQKMPFLFIFTAYFCNEIDKLSSRSNRLLS
jgi:hypothetical protein